MTTRPSIAFARFSVPAKGSAFVLSAEDGGLGDAGKACDPAGVLERAFPAVDFNAKFASIAEVLAPEGTQLDRLLALGVGKTSALDEYAWLKLGGTVAAALRKATDVTVVLDLPGHSLGAREAASLATGILLRSYAFDKYKTKKDNGDENAKKADARKPAKVTIFTADPAGPRKPSPTSLRWSTACSWRAIWSTSRPMRLARWSLQRAPRSWSRSACRWKSWPRRR